jgi:hypothetical protein
MSVVVTSDMPTKSVQRLTWASLAAGETGDAGQLGKCRNHIAVQVSGTFNTETVSMEGSLDGTNWAPLTYEGLADTTAAEEAGIPIAFSAAGICQVREEVGYIRPVVTSGTGVDIKVVVEGVGVS